MFRYGFVHVIKCAVLNNYIIIIIISSEHSSTTDHGTSSNIEKNKPSEKAHEHDENEHKLMFYLSIAFGSGFGILLFIMVIILAKRWVGYMNAQNFVIKST